MAIRTISTSLSFAFCILIVISSCGRKSNSKDEIDRGSGEPGYLNGVWQASDSENLNLLHGKSVPLDISRTRQMNISRNQTVISVFCRELDTRQSPNKFRMVSGLKYNAGFREDSIVLQGLGTGNFSFSSIVTPPDLEIKLRPFESNECYAPFYEEVKVLQVTKKSDTKIELRIDSDVLIFEKIVGANPNQDPVKSL